MEVCVALAALGPQASVERFVSASHARLGRVLGSARGYVAIAERLRDPEKDPLLGWRVSSLYAIGDRGSEEIVAVDQDLRDERYVHDPVLQAVTRDAGRNRVYHLTNPPTESTRGGSFDEKYRKLLGLVDRMNLVLALTRDVEVHIGLDRVAGEAPFDRGDEEALGLIAHGLGPWARRLALLHGRLEGQTPLSHRERELTSALLGHEPLKLIAHGLGLSEARAREIVRAVYRKLRVRGRAELASKWAGERVATEPPRVMRTRARVRR